MLLFIIILTKIFFRKIEIKWDPFTSANSTHLSSLLLFYLYHVHMDPNLPSFLFLSPSISNIWFLKINLNIHKNKNKNMNANLSDLLLLVFPSNHTQYIYISPQMPFFLSFFYGSFLLFFLTPFNFKVSNLIFISMRRGFINSRHSSSSLEDSNNVKLKYHNLLQDYLELQKVRL